MFGLTDTDLEGRILGCADGPASFNAEATRKGIRVISCDHQSTDNNQWSDEIDSPKRFGSLRNVQDDRLLH